jgi:hypothetical protein
LRRRNGRIEKNTVVNVDHDSTIAFLLCTDYTIFARR